MQMTKLEILQKEIGVKLVQNQLKIVKSEETEKIVCAGRSFGKSFTCGFIVFLKFLEGLDLVRKGKRDSLKIWIVAPSYELTTKVFNEFTKFLLKADPKMKKCISGGKGRPYELKMEQNIWIQCKSTENAQSLLGERVDLMIVDEAPLISDQVYLQNLLPPLSDGGEVIYIGTPRGKNWFYHKFLKLVPEKSRFQFKSIEGRANPEIIEAQKEEFKDERLFKQEYEAEFLEGAMQVFRDISDITFPKSIVYRPYQPGHYYLMGVDIAKLDDFTVITVIDTTDNTVVYWKRFNMLDYPTQVEQIISVINDYGKARICLDTTGLGEPVKDMLEKRGVFVEDFKFTGQSKEALIQKLRLYIANKWLRIPDEPTLRQELDAYEFVLLNEKTGEPLKHIKYGAPRGQHDDAVDSLALAVWLVIPGTPQKPNTIIDAMKKRIQTRKTIQSDI